MTCHCSHSLFGQRLTEPHHHHHPYPTVSIVLYYIFTSAEILIHLFLFGRSLAIRLHWTKQLWLVMLLAPMLAPWGLVLSCVPWAGRSMQLYHQQVIITLCYIHLAKVHLEGCKRIRVALDAVDDAVVMNTVLSFTTYWSIEKAYHVPMIDRVLELLSE